MSTMPQPPTLSRRELLAGFAAAPLARGAARPNVLFFAVDDLRPELGCYGARHIVSPNIDALAARGTTFENAYCQQAVCSPSRTSVLTGLRPDTTRIYDLQVHFRRHLPDAVTLPQNFKNHGYTTAGLGKIFHGTLEDEASWSIPHWAPGSPKWNTPENAERFAQYSAGIRERNWSAPPPNARRGQRPASWEASEKPDDELPDGRIAATAIDALRTLAAPGRPQDKPFFLGVGFQKPHLPFIAPKKYHDLYPEASKIALPDYAPEPRGVPKIALHPNGELRSYSDIPETGPVSDKQTRELVRAYYASISFMDAQVGRVMGELDRLGLRENTIVILWGDHGWQLNNHGLWHKHTNFEKAVHAPLIVSAPGQKKRGSKTPALTEFVDMYPSLCELAGIPAPATLEGKSFVPLLSDPGKKWKKAAFSQYPRGKGVMGYSVRTARYRYTEWRGAEGTPNELYDYRKDPNESENFAGQAGFDGVVAEHRDLLNKGWKAALPG